MVLYPATANTHDPTGADIPRHPMNMQSFNRSVQSTNNGSVRPYAVKATLYYSQCVGYIHYMNEESNCNLK